MATAELTGGFADPARGAAHAFRAALDCMARPGRIATLAGAVPPGEIPVAAGTLLLTLADADTPVWLAPRHAGQGAAWLAFHANAPRAEAPGAAVLAFGAWEDLLPLDRWPAGTPDYPDRGATLICAVPALEGGAPLTLSGPGIAGTARLAPALPAGAEAALSWNAGRFPLGLDVFFAAGDRLAALPRSTRIGV